MPNTVMTIHVLEDSNFATCNDRSRESVDQSLQVSGLKWSLDSRHYKDRFIKLTNKILGTNNTKIMYALL